MLYPFGFLNISGFRSPVNAAELSIQAEDGTTQSTAQFVRFGARAINMSLYPLKSAGKDRTVYFVADINKTPGATSAEIQLFDITHNALITGTNLTSTSNSSVQVISAALSVGSSSGDIRDDILTQYELQAKMNGGGGSDAIFVTNARILIVYS